MPGELPDGWRSSRLAELADESTPHSFIDGDWIESPYITHDAHDAIRLLQTGNIGRAVFVEKEPKKFISPASFEELKCKIVKPGDLLFCRLADPIGRCCRAPNLGAPMITSVDVTIVRPNPQKVDGDFLMQLGNSGDWLNRAAQLAGGSTRSRISRSNLGDLTVPLPPLPEQKKIAAILSSVDEAIQATQLVVDQIGRVKEGLLQDLLTRGLPGHTRFKQTEIGEIPELWSVRRLGDVVDTLYLSCVLEPDVAYYPAIVRRRHRGVDFPESRMGVEILVKDQYRVVPGTVLISKRQVVHGATGFVGASVPATGIVSKEYLQLIGSGELSTEYLYLWSLTPGFQNIVERCTYGVDREKFVVHERWFFSSLLPVPPKSEQIAIVDMLNGIDRAAAQNESRVLHLRRVKAGLLQDLLTGKVRVST